MCRWGHQPCATAPQLPRFNSKFERGSLARIFHETASRERREW
jgi:hypothetical protein